MIVDNALYRGGVRVPVDCEISDLSAVRERCGPEDFVWVGLHEPEQSELDAVAGGFDRHTQALEECGKAPPPPKLER